MPRDSGSEDRCLRRQVGHLQNCIGAMGFRLDYISCFLTIFSTVLVGRRMWQGWIVASANSAIICVIALRTAQLGFVPANLFCLAIYGYNIAKWRSPAGGRAKLSRSSCTTHGLVSTSGKIATAMLLVWARSNSVRLNRGERECRNLVTKN